MRSGFLVLAFFLKFASPNARSSPCSESLEAISKTHPKSAIEKICKKGLLIEPVCKSEAGRSIYHFDFHESLPKTEAPSAKILVFGGIHGDELPSSELAFSWVQRLTGLIPRNKWRIVPILNPDGLKAKTRVNNNSIDLNRNFPTADWASDAHPYWKSKGSDPRRFPGKTAGSEAEVQCALAHFAEFKPDFVVSIHTPYGVLDFDGPSFARSPVASLLQLPWRNLGTFPGSLGRYLWTERKTPLLTIELKNNKTWTDPQKIATLQDELGSLAANFLK